jgi:hypothetical protein
MPLNPGGLTGGPVQTEADVREDTQAPPRVAALPYHLDEDAGWSLEVRLIILAAMVTALNGLSTFAASTWIHLQPGRFRTVGAYRSVWSVEFAMSAVAVLINVAVVVGGAAFFARRRVCRPLLIGGSVAMLLLQCGMAVYYTFFYNSPGRYGADLAVWVIWRTGSFVTSAMVPVLTVAVMTRPYVKARFRPRTDE